MACVRRWPLPGLLARLRRSAWIQWHNSATQGATLGAWDPETV